MDRIGLKPCELPVLHRYINLKLAEMGLPVAAMPGQGDALDESLTQIIENGREKDRLLSTYLCPADNRIQAFLIDYFGDSVIPPRLPNRTLVLDQYGMARALSLPPDKDKYESPILTSYRVQNGILHNPKSDRRTTSGTFHIVEGGLPIPDDKKAVPKEAFAALFRKAFQGPDDLLRLPFTASQPAPGQCTVSLMLRPTVCPEVPGFMPWKAMEIRFFVPGSLVANLDFVESIFGNGGNPYLPENDSGLDVDHWSGHTGCVVLAPHLTTITKQKAGLPHWDHATERQKRDGMCWKSEQELYNDGQAFKLTVRDASGVIVTLIADNYFGYCKKEVKTQVSFAANLMGMAEEEHAGGAMVYPRHDLGSEYDANQHREEYTHTFDEVLSLLEDSVDVHPDGYAIDRRFPEVVYVPETSVFSLETLTIRWTRPEGVSAGIKLLLGNTYILPSGFKIHLEKPTGNRAWRLIGTRQEGTLCHKPCTVSGGGKSEISKPISDAIIFGPIFVADFDRDFDQVEEVILHNYTDRFRDTTLHGRDTRPVLSPQRTLGSVIKLLTPRREFSDGYNEWLGGIPQHIKELVLVVKRFWKPEWGNAFRQYFSVDTVNGTPANELRVGRIKLITQFLRVGYDAKGAWRTFGLRKDYFPAFKLQMEDDITASVTVPASLVRGLDDHVRTPGIKFVHNVESRLFQRPDDAIIRGYDRITEREFSEANNFFSNYEAMDREAVQNLAEDAIALYQFTHPKQDLIRAFASGKQPGPDYLVSTAYPRIVDGKPSKNPRYLQLRPDLRDPVTRHVSEMGSRLVRRLRWNEPVPMPVHAVLAGRRNNPADGSVRSLACYGPIHHMELPELFMEFISSMTGKSPSTTGAGSEGALTKGPFNALPPIHDLNAALVGFCVSGYPAFLTSAGCLGPKVRVDHDISLLIPEIWCRMGPEERTPEFLKQHGYLEKCEDQTFNGRPVLASRLGYRVTPKFAKTFLGRVFHHPYSVLTEEMLRPEMQDPAEYADAIANVVETHRSVAEHYFADESVDLACPPLRALLHIMKDGQYEGQDLASPEIRALFDRETVLASDWYADRLKAQQTHDVEMWRRHVAYLEKFLGKQNYADEAARLGVKDRLGRARVTLERVLKENPTERFRGMLGLDPALIEVKTR